MEEEEQGEEGEALVRGAEEEWEWEWELEEERAAERPVGAP